MELIKGHCIKIAHVNMFNKADKVVKVVKRQAGLIKNDYFFIHFLTGIDNKTVNREKQEINSTIRYYEYVTEAPMTYVLLGNKIIRLFD